MAIFCGVIYEEHPSIFYHNSGLLDSPVHHRAKQRESHSRTAPGVDSELPLGLMRTVSKREPAQTHGRTCKLHTERRLARFKPTARGPCGGRVHHWHRCDHRSEGKKILRIEKKRGVWSGGAFTCSCTHYLLSIGRVFQTLTQKEVTSCLTAADSACVFSRPSLLTSFERLCSVLWVNTVKVTQ